MMEPGPRPLEALTIQRKACLRNKLNAVTCHENTSLNLSREEVATKTREIVHAANRVTLASAAN